MREIRYVLLNPTGNLTCLVLDPVEEAARKAVTDALMDRCEQVGYLQTPRDSRAAARLQMMGGEFCGNASMATAAWLASQVGKAMEGETEILLEVSGADKLVPCQVRQEQDGWWGRVEMPLPRDLFPREIEGESLSAVRFPGMLHLIRRGDPLPRENAEQLLRHMSKEFQDAALGLLQWREETGEMTPLVWVRESDTLVWETACGSGTAAIACEESRRKNQSLSMTVAQPGGVLLAEAVWEHCRITALHISGKVQLGQEEVLPMPES